MNLEQIRGRCRIDEETGCWHWTGAMNTDGARGRVPVIWHEGRASSGGRVVFELSKRTIPKGQMVWRLCRCDDCLAPYHLRAGTRKEWGEWRKANGFASISPQAWAANMLAKRREARKSDPELAQIIRASSESGAEMARRHGLSKTAVSRIRLGKTWAETVPQASVFTWRP